MTKTANLERTATPVVASEFLRAAVAGMRNAPRFESLAEMASYASYELSEGQVVSGDPKGDLPENLEDDDNE
jgi:hypothetical protein